MKYGFINKHKMANRLLIKEEVIDLLYEAMNLERMYLMNKQCDAEGWQEAENKLVLILDEVYKLRQKEEEMCGSKATGSSKSFRDNVLTNVNL